MSKRVEFTRSDKIEIRELATRDGVVYCERCGCPTKRFDIHHKTMDAMVRRKRKLTAADGELLCKPCHATETAAQAPALAKAKRQEAAHLSIKKAPSRPLRSAPMPKSQKAAARASKAKDRIPVPPPRFLPGFVSPLDRKR